MRLIIVNNRVARYRINGRLQSNDEVIDRKMAMQFGSNGQVSRH